MQTILRKLSSRKLWLAIAGVAAGIAMALGVDASDITTVAGAITAIVSVATYIVTEGKIDAAAVKRAIEGTQEAMEAVGEQDDG
jgi:phage shock protein PspC (stress-responsive transcriptional regulator)